MVHICMCSSVKFGIFEKKLGVGGHKSIGLAYDGKDIVVFRFIIEYSSLRDFYRPLGNNNRSIFI